MWHIRVKLIWDEVSQPNKAELDQWIQITIMADNSNFLWQGEVESSVQSTHQQYHGSRELPSLDRQSSILSLLDGFQHTFSGDAGSLGSMNIEELLNNVLTEEEIQAYEQTLLTTPDIALSAVAPMGAATVPTAAAAAAATANINPQFPEGSSTVNDSAIQQSLQRWGSLTLPMPFSQKTVDEVWYEMQKPQQEQEHGSTANAEEVDSSQRQATNEELTLEDFLIMIGVVRAHDRSPPLQQSCVSYQNNNNTALGSGISGGMVRPVIVSGGGGNVPAYQELPERSVKDAASAAVARIPSGFQPREVGYGGKMQNDTGEGGFWQGSPVSPVSSDSLGANQSDSVNNLDMDVNFADKSSGPVEKVVSRKQCRMIKNRESAARSRARRQAYTRNLEAKLHVLEEENARLQQAMEEMKRISQQRMKEVMKAREAKDGKKGLKRSWSSLY